MSYETIRIDGNTPIPDIISETRDRWNETPTQQLLDEVDGYIFDPDSGTRLVVAAPHGYDSFPEALEDGKQVITNDLSFANGAWPWHVLGTQWIADITGDVAVSVAANGTNGSIYKFSNEEKLKLNSGDMSPYVDRGLRAIETFIGFGRMATLGFSQGANMSLVRADRAKLDHDVESAGAFDPTSQVNRNRAQLLADLSKAGYGELEKELRAADIKAFLEVFGYQDKDVFTNLRLAASFFSSVFNQLSNQWYITGGLGKKTLADQSIKLLERGTNVTIANGDTSAMMTPGQSKELVRELREVGYPDAIYLPDFRSLEFANTNHAGVDNKIKYGMFVLATLGRLS